MASVRELRAALLGTALLLSCALPVAGQNPSDPNAFGPLQGRWYSRSTESDGKQQSGVNKADLHVINGREVVGMVDGSIVSKATIKTLHLEPGRHTGTITLEMTAGSDRGKTWVAIYQVTRNTLRWCGNYVGENDTLPSAFATKAGDHYFLRTMEREKP